MRKTYNKFRSELLFRIKTLRLFVAKAIVENLSVKTTLTKKL